MSAVIFDFNGTMFLDMEFHKLAWLRYTRELGRPVTEEDFYQHMFGPTNGTIFNWLYGRTLPEHEAKKLGLGKERIYREICMEHPQELRLTEGLEDALNKLKAAGIKMTIATGSTRENVDFYMDVFGLDRWFEYDKILCDDGTFPQKPHPDIYLKAARLIGEDIQNCMVVEDSMSGYKSAYAAKAGRITMLDVTLGKEKAASLPGVTNVISDFWGFEKLFV